MRHFYSIFAGNLGQHLFKIIFNVMISSFLLTFPLLAQPRVLKTLDFNTGSEMKGMKYLKQWGDTGSNDGQFRFCDLIGIAFDKDHNVYVSDLLNHRVQKFSQDGLFIMKWGNYGSNCANCFQSPSGIAIDENEFIYVTDMNNHFVQKFTKNGIFVKAWGSFGTGDGYFHTPMGIAVDKVGNVYVVDQFNCNIQKFTSNGLFICKWGTKGSSDGQFNSPQDVAVDNLGSVYVVDYYNAGIQKFSSNGTFITRFGLNLALGFKRIAIDESGFIYATIQRQDGYGEIHKYDLTGTFITYISSIGKGEFEFNGPIGIKVDINGDIYVADRNNRIQVFAPTYCNPKGICINQKTNKIYVSLAGQNAISVIDGVHDTIQSIIPVGILPTAITTDTANNKIFVINSVSNDLCVIDGNPGSQTENSVTANIVIPNINLSKSNGLIINPTNRFLYLPGLISNYGVLSIVNSINNDIVNNISAGGYYPLCASINPEMNLIYISYYDYIGIFNCNNNLLSPRIYIGAQRGCGWIEANPVTNKVYINRGNFNQQPFRLLVLNGTDGHIEGDIETGEGDGGIALNFQSNKIYAVNSTSKTLTVVNGFDNSILGSVQVGVLPSSVNYNPITNKIYVVNTGSNSLTILSENRPPISSAGENQTILHGSVVTLDGSGCTDPELDYPLSYSWLIIKKPEGSAAVLLNPTTTAPTFMADVPGNYEIQLFVKDNKGSFSNPDTVEISTTNSAPISEAGPDQAVSKLGTIIQLDGSQSYDPDGDPLSFAWTITGKPVGSNVELSAPVTKTPSFVPDIYGDYVVSLVVNDPWSSSSLDNMNVSFNNLKPVAQAGNSQSCIVNEVVNFDGSASSDPNGDQIVLYSWSIVSKPTESNAQLFQSNTANPSIQPDVPGEYVLSLVVSDGLLKSDPSNVNIAVVSFQDAAAQTLQVAASRIKLLPSLRFKNSNMCNTLINKLNSVLLNIDRGAYQEAYNQLNNDVLKKMDGCALFGSPDNNDWITDCQTQSSVYSIILEALDYLSGL